MERYLVIDTETGGLEVSTSLLSIGAVVIEREDKQSPFRQTNKFSQFIKSSSYIVDAAALKVNNINLVEHDQIAVTQNKACQELLNFINENFNDEPAVCIGHNVQFDLKFIKKLFDDVFGLDVYPKVFSHRLFDTSSILRYLYVVGDVSEDVSSSSKAFKYFGIGVNGRHTALGDAIATAELFECLVRLRD